MKRMLAVLTMSVVPLYAAVALAQQPATQPAQPPVVGQTPLGVTVVEMESVVLGWSVKKALMGKPVVNDKNERIGKIDDIIITPNPDGKQPHASYAIIGVGGFLGVGTHNIAIPMEQIKLQSGRLVLPGATKDALKALPQFEYRK